MRAVRRALFRPVMLTALATSVVLWTVLATWAAVEQQRDEHATLAAASVAVREHVAGSTIAQVPSKLSELDNDLSTWQVSAAAFDSSGTFLGGDADLRGDGLPTGREPAPPAQRQLSIVPVTGGYVLLIRSPRSVTRFRWVAGFEFVVAVGLAALVAWLVGSGWASARARSATRASDHFRAIASGETRATPPVVDDPVFGELSESARAAIDRLAVALRDRADSEDRLRSFLADAGHELRTPLAIAVGYLGILKRGALEDPVLAERIIRDVGAEHDRLTRLVDNILHLARLDAVPGDVNASSDVARVAREAIALVRPLDLDREISCEDLPGVLAAVAPDDLRDALRNVLENAIRYADGAAIHVAIVIDGNDVVTSVRDGGPGMDAFTAAHAFDRFFRGANRDVPGTGLGLSIVRRVVERANGRVRLVTAPGAGTTVEIRLPRAGS